MARKVKGQAGIALAKADAGQADAERLGLQARQERVQKCGAELAELLKKYTCTMLVTVQVGESQRVAIEDVLKLPVTVQLKALEKQ